MLIGARIKYIYFNDSSMAGQRNNGKSAMIAGKFSVVDSKIIAFKR